MTVYKTTSLTYVAKQRPHGWDFTDISDTDLHVAAEESSVLLRHFLPNDPDHAVTKLNRTQCAELIVALYRALRETEHPNNQDLPSDRIRAAAKKPLT